MGGDERSIQSLIDDLGISLLEAAALIGVPGSALGRAAHRPYAPLQAAMERLAIMASQVDNWVAAEIDRIRHAASEQSSNDIRLLIYRRDEDLPAWSELRFASVHRVAMAKIAAAFPEKPAVLIVFEGGAYFDWLRGRRDDPDARKDWAAQAAVDRRFYFKIGGAFASSGAGAKRRNREASEFRLRRRRSRTAKASMRETGPPAPEGNGLDRST
jgi:hypothetical protein